MDPHARPEDFDAEEPEAAEVDAIKGREQIASLEGCAPLVKLLDSASVEVICGAANALFNLALHGENADALLPLGALPNTPLAALTTTPLAALPALSYTPLPVPPFIPLPTLT